MNRSTHKALIAFPNNPDPVLPGGHGFPGCNASLSTATAIAQSDTPRRNESADPAKFLDDFAGDSGVFAIEPRHDSR